MSFVAACSLYLPKLFNFINAFACYKQKCKLVPFNLAHPVVWIAKCLLLLFSGTQSVTVTLSFYTHSYQNCGYTHYAIRFINYDVSFNISLYIKINFFPAIG